MNPKAVLLTLFLAIAIPNGEADTLDLADGSAINGHVTFNASLFVIRFMQDGKEQFRTFQRDQVNEVEFNKISTNSKLPPTMIASTSSSENLLAKAGSVCLEGSSKAELWFDSPSNDLQPKISPDKQLNSVWCVVSNKSGALSDINQQKLTWLGLQAKAEPKGGLYIFSSDKKEDSSSQVAIIRDYLKDANVAPKNIRVEYANHLSTLPSPETTGELCADCTHFEIISYSVKSAQAGGANGSDAVILLNSQIAKGTLDLISDFDLELDIKGKTKRRYQRASVAGVSISH